MSNLHEQLACVCASTKKKIKYLLSLKLHNIVCGKVSNKSLILLQEWITETEEAVLNLLLESDLKHYVLHPHFEKPFNSASTLIPKSLDDTSVMIQMIVWSCVSEKCNDSIVRALCDSAQKITIPQNTAPKTYNSSCFKWLHEMAYCIKIAVFLSCRCFESMDGKGIFSEKKFSTLLVEFFCIEENVSRTADFFAIIGKNDLEGLTCIPNSPQHKVLMEKDKLTMVRETYLNYIKSGLIPKKSQMKKNQFYSGYDILSFMLQFGQIKSAQHTLKASESIRILFDGPKSQHNNPYSLYQPLPKGDNHKIKNSLLTLPKRDNHKIKNSLLTVVDLVQIELNAIPKIPSLLDQALARMKELFVGKKMEHDLSTIKRFLIMSLCGSSLAVAINEQIRDKCFYILEESFTDALIQATTEQTDGVMDPKQLAHTVFKELSRTLLSDDHFMESYLEEINVKKKLPDGENEIWKVHFIDKNKLSLLINLFPIKTSTELNLTEITEDMKEWATRTHTEPVEESDIAKYIILNLCAINIAKQKPITPIGGMCKAQQIMCHYINDALQKKSSLTNADQKMPKKIYFVRSVMRNLWNTMFKDVDFHVAFAEMLQKGHQQVFTDDDFWEIHFRNFIWKNIIYENQNCQTNSKVIIDKADIPKNDKKRKHSLTPTHTTDNSKSQKKSMEQAATQHEKRDKNLSKQGTAPDHNVESKEQKKMQPESSQKKGTVVVLRRSKRGTGNSKNDKDPKRTSSRRTKNLS